MNAKVISFDLDGTLTNSSFANFIWLEEIPRLYSKKNKITINQAKKIVIDNYSKIGNEKLEWYNINYWFKKFKLNKNPIKLLESYKNKIQLFDDVYPTLKKLNKQNKKLIIISNARREFVDLEINQTGIKKFFSYIFSATSDFNLLKNKPKIFQEVCKICGIFPSEMIHIGDDYKFDYEVPKTIGIRATFLNREKQTKSQMGVSSLIKLVADKNNFTYS